MKEIISVMNLQKVESFFFILFFISNTLIASQPPLSIQEYGACPEKTIAHFNDRFNVALNKPMDGENHALSDTKNRDTLIAVSEEINHRYTGNVIVSVGQSPAYIIKAAQLLNELTKNSKTEYRYLAFSGKFLDEVGIHDQRKEFVASTKNIPTEKEIASYTEYLKSLQLDPKTIIERHSIKSQKTIFADFISSARGFASFVYILNAIARKEGVEEKSLQNSVGYHVFHMKEQALTSKSIHIKDARYSYVCDLSNNNVHAIEKKLIFNLAREQMNILFNDRLVQHFPKSSWTENSPDQFNLSDNAKLLIFKIIHHIAGRAQDLEPSKKKQKV